MFTISTSPERLSSAISGIGMVASQTVPDDEVSTDPLNPGLYNTITTLISSFDIDMTRYPGGKPSSDFNWITGLSPQSPGGEYAFPVSKLNRWMEDCGIPRVMLVVSVFEPVATVMSYLAEAASNGVPITHITLGNEIFGEGLTYNGDPRAWTGTEYGTNITTGDDLVGTIRAAYPNAKLYGVAIGKFGDTSRQNTWNDDVLATGLDALVDGWDTHIYVPTTQTVDVRFDKYESFKINSNKEVVIGEYGTRNSYTEIFEVKRRLQYIADITINFAILNFTEIFSKIDYETGLLTTEGADWLARQ